MTNFIQINDSTPKNIQHQQHFQHNGQSAQIDLVMDQEMSSPKTAAPWNRNLSMENNQQQSTLSPWNTTISPHSNCQTPPVGKQRFPSDKMDIAHDFSKTSTNIWSTTTGSSTDRSLQNINSPPWSTHHAVNNTIQQNNNQSPVRFDKYLDSMRNNSNSQNLSQFENNSQNSAFNNFEHQERERSERVARAPWNQQSDDEKLLLNNNSPADSVNFPSPSQISLQQQVSPTLQHGSPSLNKHNGILDAPLQQQMTPPPPPPPPSTGLPRSTPNIQGKYLIEDDEGRAVEETVLWTGVKLRKPDGRDMKGKRLQIVGPTFHQMQQRKQQKPNQRKNSPSAVRKHSPKTASVGTPGSNTNSHFSGSTPGSSAQRVISSCSPAINFQQKNNSSN